LVPWNSCGAYMTGVLGVPTIEYLPYAIFNIVNPLIALLFGFTGIGVERLSASVGKRLPGRTGESAVPQ
jgi:NhaC family Na+:H+ antiporter